MKRLATSAVAIALLAAVAGGAQAQDGMGRRASLFDLGIYAGGAYTTDWFTTPEQGGEEEGWAPGISPIFGLQATYWIVPQFGVRLHGAYMPQNLPESENVEFDDNWVVNSYLYDLDLVWRPWFYNPGFLGGTYLWVGGGGYTANIAGGADDVLSCVTGIPAWNANGVCVPENPSYGTTGMATVGLGFDVFPLSSSLGIFGELGLHGYDSPAHVCDEAGCPGGGNAEDKFTFTPRAVLGLKAMFGDILPPPVVVIPPPPVVIPPPPVVVPPPVVRDDIRDIRVCVVQGDMLTEVTVQYNVTRGDSLVNGQPFSTVYPTGAQYAANATWYINNEPITFGNRRYVKYGLPRVLGVNEVTRVGDYQGVGVFAETGATDRPEVVYIPVRPGCEFQPYQTEVKTGGVRGE